MKQRIPFKDQLQRNAVAIISLFIAVSGLFYNTWRNELTEENQNQRTGCFEVLLKLGELQQLVYHLHYDMDDQRSGNQRTGWALVQTISDISVIIEAPVGEAAVNLKQVWGEHEQGLGESKASVDAINEAIETLRSATQDVLTELT
ncbi:MAG: hypothetical protein QNJ05_09260 [Woeseiaceae bacterium]|nr:hypothetical protein [Woeseiaceae bacterium]